MRDVVFDFLGFLSQLCQFLPAPIVRFLYGMLYSFTGVFWRAMRYVLVNAMKKGGPSRKLVIFNNVEFRNISRLKAGNNVSIHPFCYLDAYGEIDIGNNVSIAHGCSLVSFEHSWDNIDIPIKYNRSVGKKIIIEDDVWIGCGARILSGSYIEKRSVIAAGAVVKGRVESGWVYGGVPAKKIKRI